MRQLVLELAPAPTPTLENFALGTNARAVAAVRELVSSRSAPLATLYLWGSPGSGRTHLLRAALSAADSAGLSGSYLEPGSFDTAHIEPAPLIALDDVDRLGSDEQLAAFDLFNLQRAAHGRWLAAGERPPAQLALRDDLRTRLGSGVVIELTPLDDDAQLAALRAHAADRGFTIGEDILAYLLRNLRRDMGTQMAILDALDRASLEMKRPLTLPFARGILHGLQPDTSTRP